MIKIKHNISLQEDERTLSGRILEVQFLDGAERGYCKDYLSKDGKFSIASVGVPALYRNTLYVWGKLEEYDNDEVSYTYSSKEEALKVLDYINEFSIEEVERETYTKQVRYIVPDENLVFPNEFSKEEETIIEADILYNIIDDACDELQKENAPYIPDYYQLKSRLEEKLDKFFGFITN